MPKEKKRIRQDFAFFQALLNFYADNNGTIRRRYKQLTKQLLDFNDPELRSDAYLRQPQFEALEIYVFLKEFGNNRHVHDMFREWARNEGVFEDFRTTGADSRGQSSLLGFLDLEGEEQYDEIFARLSERARSYPNYIFALTMGLGKTILMATCIFYEFLLANKFGRDMRFCKNALVFAPDKTVLQSLKEIQTFDLGLVVPPEYANFLRANLKFHFLDDTASTIGAQDGSSFNVIISNTQKIILKRRSAAPSTTEKLFSERTGSLSEVYGELYEMLGEEAPESDADLAVNARFQRIARLPQLGIYVDEAHHSMGASLEKDLGQAKDASALRTTIDELARALDARKTSVVGCYNFTGTPYVKDRIMPEVVYAYGLKAAIDNKYLKQPEFIDYSGNVKSNDFLRELVTDFWSKEGEKRREGMLPKLAIFASAIEELTAEVRPALEKIMAELGIPTTRILVNVGDDKLTTGEDIREFNRLDTPDSEKQFILLVGKGREGWNCRSLFGVALYRKAKSKIFVLQSTMRCLRAIGDVQETGRIYLSADNMKILEDELQQNFRVTTEELGPKKGDESEVYEVTAVPPPVVLKMKRRRELFKTKRKETPDKISFDLSEEVLENYRAGLRRRKSINSDKGTLEDITDRLQNRTFSAFTLIGEIARYFSGDGVSPFAIEGLLERASPPTARLVELVNTSNDILYDVIIPTLFRALFEIEPYGHDSEEEIELVKGYNVTANRPPTFRFKAKPHLVAGRDYPEYSKQRDRTFHLDHYCFDSQPEVEFFNSVLELNAADRIYFTGMLVHGQSGFRVNYIHPESHTVCNYYPDFLIIRESGEIFLIEVKSAWKEDDPVVIAKREAAEQLAAGNQFRYALLTRDDFPGFLSQQGGWQEYERA
ncbi:Tn7 transposase TnsA N-terminal domain-containing protein [Hyphomonas sp. WL0036]|uniref:TnsA endonuclease N-terminal domain-containing protein n=1 Tax=Hyphomonas sediminis TaxID=2866160 RepID=UPI001C7F399C|nr:TnsA endonuclease N-terminal domain-containing protein [Hyphomonas sediminis]MBY9068238.1 Tn7 transposase TnsA N-terminal domain-containing protein [Hyphomonas sediminis]